MIKKIDELGRIVIPNYIRKKLNIKSGDELAFGTIGNKITLELVNGSYLNKEDIEILKMAVIQSVPFCGEEDIRNEMLKKLDFLKEIVNDEM